MQLIGITSGTPVKKKDEELIQPLQIKILKSNGYKIDLERLYFKDESRIQESRERVA